MKSWSRHHQKNSSRTRNQNVLVRSCRRLSISQSNRFSESHLCRWLFYCLYINDLRSVQNKRPRLSTRPFVLIDAWQFPTLAWGDPTLPSALRRFTSEFGMGSGGTTALVPPGKFFSKCRTLTVITGADTQSRTGDLTLTKGALYQLSHISTLNLMPGSSLLSHGETPHYHRRYGVSLLSSAWGQVGPPR
ncbi:Hypothetical protein AKI40_0516 [Enterobacter sp. FY-07]|nr:Hypothetical protein AKI40_0516 [Enterobacter sp. FY-07]